MGMLSILMLSSLIGAAILLRPLLATFWIVEVVACIGIALLDFFCGYSIGFILESIVVFLVCSTFVFFVLAICGAMIAYGRMSRPRYNADGAQRNSRESISALVSTGLIGFLTKA